jgi:hypothetical protein
MPSDALLLTGHGSRIATVLLLLSAASVAGCGAPSIQDLAVADNESKKYCGEAVHLTGRVDSAMLNREAPFGHRQQYLLAAIEPQSGSTWVYYDSTTRPAARFQEVRDVVGVVRCDVIAGGYVTRTVIEADR